MTLVVATLVVSPAVVAKSPLQRVAPAVVQLLAVAVKSRLAIPAGLLAADVAVVDC